MPKESTTWQVIWKCSNEKEKVWTKQKKTSQFILN